MTLIPIIVTVVLLALVVSYITRPLFTADPQADLFSADENTSIKEAAYQALLERIRELDIEFDLGKLNEQDHLEQRAALVREAAETLRDLRMKEPSISPQKDNS